VVGTAIHSTGANVLGRALALVKGRRHGLATGVGDRLGT
jgi:hypothetical protein